MFRFLPAALALAGLAAAPGCLTESAEFRSLAAAVTDARGQEASDQRPGHERLADIPAPQDTPDRNRTEAAWTLSDAFAEVARVATPGVVSLLVERESTRGADDPRLEQFFGFPPGSIASRGRRSAGDPARSWTRAGSSSRTTTSWMGPPASRWSSPTAEPSRRWSSGRIRRRTWP